MPVLKNPKHEAFVANLLKGMTQGPAYIAAGYRAEGHAAEACANKLLKNAEVAARLAELQAAVTEKAVERTAITKERVLDELGKLGFSNMLDYVSPRDDGLVHIDLSALTRDQAAAIQEVTIDQYEEGEGDEAKTVNKVKFKLSDKRAALVEIGKHLGMFKDKLEITGKDGGAIKTEDVGARELARRLAMTLARGA